MSRSRKKSMGGGHTSATSEKWDKKIWHRKYRSVNRTILKHFDGEQEPPLKKIREMSDTWLMDKDDKYLIMESDVRNALAVVMSKVRSSGEYSKYDEPFFYLASDIYDDLCLYLKKRRKLLRNVSDKTLEQFVQHYVNKEKRK